MSFLFTQDFVFNVETGYSDDGTADEYLYAVLNQGDPIGDPHVVAIFTAAELQEILLPHILAKRVPDAA